MTHEFAVEKNVTRRDYLLLFDKQSSVEILRRGSDQLFCTPVNLLLRVIRSVLTSKEAKNTKLLNADFYCGVLQEENLLCGSIDAFGRVIALSL